jgi:hypothetical protein
VAADVAAAERAAAAKLLADKRAAKEAAEEELRRRCTALGLLQALTDANVADNEILKKATAFFDEHGIPSVSEMVKYDMVDEFISHLGLKAFPGRKLRGMLLPPTSEGSTVSVASTSRPVAPVMYQQPESTVSVVRKLPSTVFVASTSRPVAPVMYQQPESTVSVVRKLICRWCCCRFSRSPEEVLL